MDPARLVDEYVAVWNEEDDERRRARIRSVWAADGRTCYRLADSRGPEAIEQRVLGSWSRWLAERRYIFRPANWLFHHDALALRFELVRLADRAIEARGLAFLLLDQQGRVTCDYQFNPTANDAEDLTQKYLAPASEATEARRAFALIENWSADATLYTDDAILRGRREIGGWFDAWRIASVREGSVLCPGERSQRHHEAGWLQWSSRSADADRTLATRSSLMIFDGAGHIERAYEFAEPVAAGVQVDAV